MRGGLLLMIGQEQYASDDRWRRHLPPEEVLRLLEPLINNFCNILLWDHGLEIKIHSLAIPGCLRDWLLCIVWFCDADVPE